MLDALRYPIAGESGSRLGTFATGALLSALGVLVVPAILVAGYYGRVLSGSAAGERRPPTFEDWRALFVQGLKTWLVVAAYVALALGVAVVLGVAALVLGAFETGAGSVVGLLAWAVGGLIVLGLALGPAWFFLPAALAHAARKDDIGAVLEAGTIRRIALRREYLFPWFAGLVVMTVGSLVYGLAGSPGAVLAGFVGRGTAPTVALALLGHVVGAAANFYCQVTAFHVFGRGYGSALDAAGGETATERSTDEPGEPAGNREWGAEARAWRERRRKERERKERERA